MILYTVHRAKFITCIQLRDVNVNNTTAPLHGGGIDELTYKYTVGVNVEAEPNLFTCSPKDSKLHPAMPPKRPMCGSSTGGIHIIVHNHGILGPIAMDTSN